MKLNDYKSYRKQNGKRKKTEISDFNKLNCDSHFFTFLRAFVHQDKIIKRQLCERFFNSATIEFIHWNSYFIILWSLCEGMRRQILKSSALTFFLFCSEPGFFCRVFCHIERIGPWPFDLRPWTLTSDMTFSVILVQLVYTLWRLDQYVIEFYVQVRILYTYVYVLFRKKRNKQLLFYMYIHLELFVHNHYYCFIFIL